MQIDCHRLDIGRTPASLLSMSNFKCVTRFGFLIENCTPHIFWIFVKPQNRLVWPAMIFWKKRCFLECFWSQYRRLSSKSIFYWAELSYAHYVRMTSSCLCTKFQQFLKNRCFVLTITCTRGHSIIEHKHTSLTSLKTKNRFPSELRHLRRTRDLGTRAFDEKNPILLSTFLIWRYLESYVEKGGENLITKMYKSDLDSPHWELFVRGLGFVVRSPYVFLGN